jgi:uncharacterized coiled-coil DUF342 family protein
MKEDFSELVGYLDKKFGTVDQKLIELDEDIKDVRERMVTKEEFQDLQTSVDAYAQKADTYFQEMVMLAHKVDRHEKWFHQVADKLGIKLEY